MFEKLDSFLDSFLEMGVPGYDTAVMKDGELIYRRTSGYSDLERKIPMSGKERYNIYSCSKPITAVAALQLFEKGMFRLEDKLSDYMPEFSDMTIRYKDGSRVTAKNPILIEHLFTMAAGFSYDTSSPSILSAQKETGGICPTREVMRYLAKEPLLFEPGTNWAYSLCHDVLAAFVEVVSGERFGEYVKKNIFDPLGMKDSTFLLPDDELDSICTQYAFSGTPSTAKAIDKKIVFYKFGREFESGGAGCISSVDDYMKFLEALRLGNSILKSETVDLMCIDRLCEAARKDYWYTDYGYGLGVRCPIEGKTTDFGWGGAAGAYAMVDRVNNITIYHAQHTLYSPNAPQRRVLTDVVKECLHLKNGAKTDRLHTSDETLKKYQ